MSNENDIARGERARELLENPLLREVLAEIRDAYIEELIRTALPHAVQGKIHALEDFQRALRERIEAAQIAAFEIEMAGRRKLGER